MNILIISDCLPIKGNIAGLFAADQAKALHNEKQNVFLFAFDSYSFRAKRKKGVFWINDYPFKTLLVRTPIGRHPLNVCAFLSSVAFRHYLKKYVLKVFKPDIVHAHFFFQGYLAGKAKDLLNCPVVVTEHSSLINRENIERKYYALAKKAYSMSDALISVSDSLRNRIHHHFGIDSQVVHNVVDTSTFKLRRRTLSTCFSFISVGSLLPNKSMDVLIRSFYVAFKNDEKVCLTIVGSGPEFSKLNALVSSLKMEKRIVLKGRLSRNDIANEFEKSDCFVLVSKSETFGVSYVEAMLSGLPVIATKCGGPEGFVNPDSGVLVDVDDIDGISKAMIDAVEKAKRYNPAKISNYAKARFSPESIASSLITIYNELLSGCKGKGESE